MLRHLASPLLAAPLKQQALWAAGFHASAAPQSTVFDKLGGKENVKAAVEQFYGKIMADPTVNTFFEGIDMKKQKAKQMQFMTLAFGGPNDYKGRSMYEAHKGMGLTEKEFNAVAGHFISTLQEMGVDQKVIDDAVAVVLTTKPAILGQVKD